jgi:hypothetical protein
MRAQTVLAILFLAAGCGVGSQSPGGSGGSGGTHPPSTGGSGGSGGSGGNGGSGGSGGSGGGGTGPIEGSVSAFSYSDSGEAGYGVSAGFGASDGCTTNSIGPCDLGSCGTATMYPNAGTLTLTGGMQTVTLTPGTDGSYSDASGTTALWNGGETLTITASGGTVPAFSGSLRAPTPITVTGLAGAAWPTAMVNVARTTDLVVTWTPASGTVLIGIGNQTSGMTCLFDASAGTGTIPSQALQMLAAGMAELDVSSGDQQMLMAGSIPVNFSLSTGAVAAGNAGGYANLMLQ